MIYRSGYVPWIIGILLVIDGFAWMVDSLQAYFYPDANLKYLFVAFLGELVFMLWLLIRGWTIREPQGTSLLAPSSDIAPDALIPKA